jgi:uncharacterized membrane protein
MLSLAFLMAITVSLMLFIKKAPYDPRHAVTVNTITLASNIIYALAIIGMIVLGYIRRHTAYINIGLLFFVLDVLARYFDFFWKLLPRSIFFIMGGIILLLGGVLLEKKRRKILATFNPGKEV